MKKFEEEFDKKVSTFDVVGHHNGVCCLVEEVKALGKDWVSPEDYQQVVEDLTNARSSITNLMAQLDYYKKDKRFEVMAEEILSLKSQLEKQQPELPEFVAEYIEAAKEDCWTLFNALDDSLSLKVGDWLRGGNFSNQEILAQAWLYGYTVAKEKRFYLKNKLTGLYLYENDKGFSECERGSISWASYKTEFTQSEIDSMGADSYEKIEVGDD
ncbi:DUF1642 domain-containing protein [Lactococcus formosensis]|uniref:DUF1642 domain-containing protein n=1 Tax=Lactococcus formosensis TaxID=1281486 RepID=UPI001F057577|nr:DUF1642 domain-containing protein [Lactococcus formosensis]MCH1723328.1 DUF1642 domain-containing protein [Lactococcus formosensis]